MKYYVKKLPLSFDKELLHKLDDNGILLSKIPYSQIYDYDLEAISSYALINMEDYMDAGCKKKMLDQVDWLVKNIDENGTWKQNFKIPFYKIDKPWTNGMGQGLAISALIRAYQLTADQKYLETAKKAFAPYEKEVKDGGLVCKDNKCYWVEECPAEPFPHILNGFIYALFGAYDLHIIKMHKGAGEIWDKCIETLERNLPSYDLGYWSRYNLVDEHPSELIFHQMHIEQLKALYELTDKKIFKEYADKWQGYLNTPYYIHKARFKRVVAHFKKHGILGAMKRYVEKRRWLSG
jgi:hypothetical protein